MDIDPLPQAPRERQGVWPRPDRNAFGKAAWVLLSIALAGLVFNLLFAPAPPPGVSVFWLSLNPQIEQTITRTLHERPAALLLPMQYEIAETSRYYWPTASLLVLYGLYQILPPFGVYLFLSTLFGVTVFVLSWCCCRQLVLSASLTFMLLFGTHLHYQFTYGWLLDGYLVLTYISVNLFIATRLLTHTGASWRWYAAYIGTLIVVAWSSEVWLNYGVGVLVAALFLSLWGKRHGYRATVHTCTFVGLTTLAIMAAYLVIHLRIPSQYTVAGAEEELVVTYNNPVFLVEDMVTNFFTLLYMTLSNYLPSFVTASNSLVYFGAGPILAEQHGYHAQYTHLVVMSHLLQWRFYAGVLVAAYLYCVGQWLRAALRHDDIRYAVYAALSMMVLTGFSTHVLIKMRPYNVVPALPYKAIVSIYAFTLLLAYVAATGRQWFTRSKAYGAALCSLWVLVFVAACTRPHMQSALLANVGLVGLGDPLTTILQWFQ